MRRDYNNRKFLSNGTDLTQLEKDQLKKREEAFSKETKKFKKELKSLKKLQEHLMMVIKKTILVYHQNLIQSLNKEKYNG